LLDLGVLLVYQGLLGLGLTIHVAADLIQPVLYHLEGKSGCTFFGG
jgi:hypothetical protein